MTFIIFNLEVLSVLQSSIKRISRFRIPNFLFVFKSLLSKVSRNSPDEYERITFTGTLRDGFQDRC